jgi:potassium/chloride transporter 9
MSGDLKHPSKAIPKGTLYGLGLTFALYTTVIFVLAASVSRETFYNNTNVIQLVRYIPPLQYLESFASLQYSLQSLELCTKQTDTDDEPPPDFT